MEVSYTDRIRSQNAEMERLRLREMLDNEVKSLGLQIASYDKQLQTLDASASKLQALQEPVGELPAEIFTLGRASLLGAALPSGRVRDLVALALNEGIGWLSQRRSKIDGQRKVAADRLAVVEGELSEKFDAVAE